MTAISTPAIVVSAEQRKRARSIGITYLVLDEADRMFDMGFGEQVGTTHRLLL